MIAFSNAKINIGLHIYDKMPNGYHNIESIFYPVNWQDTIEIIVKENSNEISYHNYGLKVDGAIGDNLIIKAFKLLQSKHKLSGADIYHLKNIPMGAGLGGGSANAAFTLLLINKVYKLGLSKIELKQYASTLGSDCVFFIENKPAYVFGRGDILEPINLNLSKYYYVIVKPNIHVSTATAYKYANKRGVKKELTKLTDYIDKPVKDWKNYFSNDFENYVFSEYPEIEKIKTKLYSKGAAYASMSGSGTSVYGIFENEVNLKNEFIGYAYHADFFSKL